MTVATAALDIHLILRRGPDILLGRRRGNVYGRGQWALPCGKVHPAEPFPDAAIREADEELGITISTDQLALAHTVAISNGDDHHLGVFYEVRHWTGTITNREPDKCEQVRWFPLAKLAQPLMDYSAVGITGYLQAPGAMTTYDAEMQPTTVRAAAG